MLTYFKNLFKKKEPKYCVDCKWIKKETIVLQVCGNPNVIWNKIDLVYGKTTKNLTCLGARSFHLNNHIFNTCGPKAKYFEPK